jgi:hypothetical protein
MRNLRPGLLVSLALTAALPAGCGGGPRPHPVSGQVSLQGKGLAGAVVVFHPAGAQAVRPLLAVTDEAGLFRLTTSKPGDGAPVGKYAVTVVWRELKRDGDEVLRNGRNLLPARYENPETSGLSATVHEGPNKLPAFEVRGE